MSRAYAYDTLGYLTSITSSSNRVLIFQGSSRLPSLVTWQGEVNGTVGYSWGSLEKLTSLTINGSNYINFTYDDDEDLTQAHDLSISRDASTGFISSTSVGLVTTSHIYNGFRESTQVASSKNIVNLVNFSYLYDALGRISQIKKVTSAGTTVTNYNYDSIGQLSSETSGGVTKTYTYTDNGNRLTSGGAEVYDSHDRLVSNNEWTYSYNKNGYVTRKDHVSNGSYVLYTYDVLGNLLTVQFSGGNKVDYLVDGLDRRMQRKLNNSFSAAYIYQDGIRPVAQLNSGGSVVSLFVYGTKSNVPDLITKSGITYRVISDRLGSVLFVLRASNGVIPYVSAKVGSRLKVALVDKMRILDGSERQFMPSRKIILEL